MKNSSCLYIIISILLVLLFVYFFIKCKSISKINEKYDIKDSYIRSWIDKYFDFRGSYKDSFENNDEAIVLIKGIFKVGFVANYHYLTPQKIIKNIKKKYPDCIIVILDAEPNNLSDVNLDHNDFIITTKHEMLPSKGHIIYLPYYIWHMITKGISLDVLIKSNNDHKISTKSKFCVFAYSNCDKKYNGVVQREKFFVILQKLSGGRVDNLGKCLNGKRVGGHGNNDDLFGPYKFAIVFENDKIPGYVSEKLVNAMLSGCIPIYFGAPDVGTHFNTKSFINVSDFLSLDDCAKFVMQVDNDDTLARKIRNESYLNDNNTLVSDKYIKNLEHEIKIIFPFPAFLPLKINSKFILQTFADGNEYKYDRILNEAKLSGYFDELHAATLNDLDPIFVDKHKNFIKNNKRGYGYWIWKPQVIYERLMQMNDDEYLLWIDSGCTIQSGSSHTILSYIREATPILAFTINHKTSNWTKMDLYIHMLSDTSLIPIYSETQSITASIIIFKKCNDTINIVNEWRHICEEYHMIDDTPSMYDNNLDFKEHRHDQAVFNLLCKIHKIPENMDNYYDDKNNYLLSDGTPRPFVPTRKKH